MHLYNKTLMPSTSVVGCLLLDSQLIVATHHQLKVYSLSLQLISTVSVPETITHLLRLGSAIVLVTSSRIIELSDPVLQVETETAILARTNGASILGVYSSVGLFQVYTAGVSFQTRLDTLDIVDFVFISENVIAVLAQDAREHKVVSSYALMDRDLVQTPGSSNGVRVDSTALFLMPLSLPAESDWSVSPKVTDEANADNASTQKSMPINGFIVVGQATVGVYMANATKPSHTLPVTPTIFKAYCQIDAHRYILADMACKLYILVVERDSITSALKLKFDVLGDTGTQASVVCYCGDGMVFVGSHFGDSKLVRLIADGQADIDDMDHDHEVDSSKDSGLVRTLSTIEGLAPITDMCLLESCVDKQLQPALQQQQQQTLVTCCGAYASGSLKIVRSGIGIAPFATMDMDQLGGVWSLKSHSNTEFDSVLVLGFADQTRVLHMKDSDDGQMQGALDEWSRPDCGIIQDQATLSCSNVHGDSVVQVISSDVDHSQSRSLA